MIVSGRSIISITFFFKYTIYVEFLEAIPKKLVTYACKVKV